MSITYPLCQKIITIRAFRSALVSISVFLLSLFIHGRDDSFIVHLPLLALLLIAFLLFCMEYYLLNSIMYSQNPASLKIGSRFLLLLQGKAILLSPACRFFNVLSSLVSCCGFVLIMLGIIYTLTPITTVYA